MAKIVMVTGMHRSGTSLLGSVLRASGIDMGDRLVPAGKGNIKGHFEDADFVEFHQRILDRDCVGQPRPAPDVTAADRALASRLLAAREHKPAWGCKDPRTALFIDLWDELVPMARWVFVVRHPFSVVDSLRRRDGNGTWWWGSDTRQLKTWGTYTANCLRFAQRAPQRSLVIEVDRGLRRTGELSRSLSKFLAHPIEEASFHELYDESLLDRQSKWFSTFVTPWDYLQALQLHRRACRMSAV